MLLSYIDAVPLTSGFTKGVGQIWLDNVQCVGTERKLDECTSSAVGFHNCDATQDAGVRCQGTANTCNEGDIRLQGSIYQGRVEVCYNQLWGTVCSHNWDATDAAVACRQLGLHTVGKFIIQTLHKRL